MQRGRGCPDESESVIKAQNSGVVTLSTRDGQRLVSRELDLEVPLTNSRFAAQKLFLSCFLPVPGLLPPCLRFDSVESVCESRGLCVVVAFPLISVQSVWNCVF